MKLKDLLTQKHKPTELDLKRDAMVATLAKNIERARPDLQALLNHCNHEWGGEDGFYRFYHQSFKVFYLQDFTIKIVNALRALAPPAEPDIQLAGRSLPGIGSMNGWFLTIIEDGTGRHFNYSSNTYWLDQTRPIIEAYLHAKQFLELVLKYGEQLKENPRFMDPGYAALLSLYNLR